MTGTDEHGAKIVEAAEANGTTPQEWTDRTSARFVDAWRRLGISNDDFIRTTEPRHDAVVQQFLQRIYDNGFIEPGYDRACTASPARTTTSRTRSWTASARSTAAPS